MQTVKLPPTTCAHCGLPIDRQKGYFTLFLKAGRSDYHIEHRPQITFQKAFLNEIETEPAKKIG